MNNRLKKKRDFIIKSTAAPDFFIKPAGAWFDTTVTQNNRNYQRYRLEIEFEYTSSNTSGCILGGCDANGNSNMFKLSCDGSNFICYVYTGSRYTRCTTIDVTPLQRYKILIEPSDSTRYGFKLTINDVFIGGSELNSSGDTRIPFYFGALNQGETATQLMPEAKIYSFKIYAPDGTMRNNYIPKRIGGKMELYDTVNQSVVVWQQ